MVFVIFMIIVQGDSGKRGDHMEPNVPDVIPIGTHLSRRISFSLPPPFPIPHSPFLTLRLIHIGHPHLPSSSSSRIFIFTLIFIFILFSSISTNSNFILFILHLASCILHLHPYLHLHLHLAAPSCIFILHLASYSLLYPSISTYSPLFSSISAYSINSIYIHLYPSISIDSIDQTLPETCMPETAPRRYRYRCSAASPVRSGPGC